MRYRPPSMPLSPPAWSAASRLPPISMATVSWMPGRASPTRQRADPSMATRSLPFSRAAKVSPPPRCILLAERGLLDYDDPIATYWPEFAANGKASITVRHALTHTAGLPQMPQGAVMTDWDGMCWRLPDDAAVGAGHAERLPRPDLRLDPRRTCPPRRWPPHRRGSSRRIFASPSASMHSSSAFPTRLRHASPRWSPTPPARTTQRVGHRRFSTDRRSGGQ